MLACLSSEPGPQTRLAALHAHILLFRTGPALWTKPGLRPAPICPSPRKRRFHLALVYTPAPPPAPDLLPASVWRSVCTDRESNKRLTPAPASTWGRGGCLLLGQSRGQRLEKSGAGCDPSPGRPAHPWQCDLAAGGRWAPWMCTPLSTAGGRPLLCGPPFPGLQAVASGLGQSEAHRLPGSVSLATCAGRAQAGTGRQGGREQIHLPGLQALTWVSENHKLYLKSPSRRLF